MNLGKLSFNEFHNLAVEHYDRGGQTFADIWTEEIFNRWGREEKPITRMMALSWFRKQEACDKLVQSLFDNSNYRRIKQ